MTGQACGVMGIPSPGESAKSGQPTFSESIFKVELQGPKHHHLSVIDVPGIFRATTEGLTTDDDIALVEAMVQRFIQNERTIILAVIACNVDIATQGILRMAKVVDPHGQRTLGVLTKPDLVDKGAEKDTLELVQGRRHKLRLGYCVVRNRAQQERDITTAERHKKESLFFSSGPFSTISKNRIGIPSLHKRLRDLLNDITQREFPNVKREISHRISACEIELENLGPSRESDDEQRRYLLQIAEKFQAVTNHALDSRYGTDGFFSDEAMRLATRIVTMNEDFAEAVEKNGCTVKFDGDSVLPKDDIPELIRKLELTPRSLQATRGNDLTEVNRASSGDRKKYSELDEVLSDLMKHSAPPIEDILSWIEGVYKSSRGFELGSFDPALLPYLFQQQTINWEHLATSYINDVILHIHRFCDHLVSYLCPENRVKTNLWSNLIEELLLRYKKTAQHVKFILRTEREGNLITANHYFSDNLEKARARRFDHAMNEATEQIWDSNRNAMKVIRPEKLLGMAGVANLKHTVRDIHDILESYYKVARKRFVDNICMQATDGYLVSGPESPLRVLSPIFVGQLTSNQLEAIAGEDTTSIQRRRELHKEIESLQEGRRVLAS